MTFSFGLILGSVPIEVLGDAKELIVLYTGDRNQEIHCNSTRAVPSPAFRWKKYGIVSEVTLLTTDRQCLHLLGKGLLR